MNFTDLLIIYLACGAPFGVYQITTHKNRSAADAARMFLSFLFWPAFAASIIIDRVANGQTNSNSFHNSAVDDIRAKIEQAAFSNSTAASLFEFREVYHRYTGLSEVVESLSSSKYSSEFFEISGHQNKALAAKCLARENRRKIVCHHAAARLDFTRIVTELVETVPKPEAILGLTFELARQVNDEAIVVDLRAGMSDRRDRPAPPIAALPAAVWQSANKIEITVN